MVATMAAIAARTRELSGTGKEPTMKIQTVSRPYIMTFAATGTSYRLTSDDAQRAINEYPVVSATRHRVILSGHNTLDAQQRVIIRPATAGGGPAFLIER